MKSVSENFVGVGGVVALAEVESLRRQLKFGRPPLKEVYLKTPGTPSPEVISALLAFSQSWIDKVPLARAKAKRSKLRSTGTGRFIICD